jgi:hypothetical protein
MGLAQMRCASGWSSPDRMEVRGRGVHITGLEAATAALGSVVIEGSHRDPGCDGGGVGTGHGHSPDRHGVGPCAAVKVFGFSRGAAAP